MTQNMRLTLAFAARLHRRGLRFELPVAHVLRKIRKELLIVVRGVADEHSIVTDGRELDAQRRVAFQLLQFVRSHWEYSSTEKCHIARC